MVDRPDRRLRAAGRPALPAGGDALRIWNATEADLPAIFEIYNEQVLGGTATFDTEPKDPERDRTWLTDRDPARHPTLVAELDDVVVGWAGLFPWSPRRAYDRSAEVSVYVDAGRRRHGVGRALLQALLEHAAGTETMVIQARIAEGNPGSQALFASFGFGHIGKQRRCGQKFGRILDVDLYDRHLDEPG